MLLGKVEMSGVVGRMERKEDGGGWEGLLKYVGGMENFAG